MLWMRDQGVRFVPIYGRQAYKIDGRFTFYGGLTVEAAGGGPGLMEALMGAAAREGIEVLYGANAVSLVYDDFKVVGVNVKHQGEMRRVAAKSVVLACGGFEANPEWRTRYLGPGWELCQGPRHALQTPATASAWRSISVPRPTATGPDATPSGGTATPPEFGDLAVGDGFQKHSYTLGIVVNADGQRFVDEGRGTSATTLTPSTGA